jgi:hypothetical protein
MEETGRSWNIYMKEIFWTRKNDIFYSAYTNRALLQKPRVTQAHTIWVMMENALIHV